MELYVYSFERTEEYITYVTVVGTLAEIKIFIWLLLTKYFYHVGSNVI